MAQMTRWHSFCEFQWFWIWFFFLFFRYQLLHFWIFSYYRIFHCRTFTPGGPAKPGFPCGPGGPWKQTHMITGGQTLSKGGYRCFIFPCCVSVWFQWRCSVLPDCLSFCSNSALRMGFSSFPLFSTGFWGSHNVKATHPSNHLRQHFH